MQVVRQLKKVQDKQIIINLPESFYAQEVEVIVIPYKKMVPLDDKNLWKQYFLSVSQWEITEKDIKIPSWKIEEISSEREKGKILVVENQRNF